MRLLPHAERPPEVEGAVAVDVDLLEQDGEKSLFERLHAIALDIVPQHMHQVEATKKLRPQHIPAILLRVQGYKHHEISQTLGVSPAQVHRILNSQEGQALLSKLFIEAGMETASVGRAFLEAAPMAADVLMELAQEGIKEETRLKAAFSILDRAGYGATKKNETMHKVEVVSQVSNTELDELRNALREALEIEADFEVVAQEASVVAVEAEES